MNNYDDILKKGVKNGDAEQLIKSLKPEDARKLSELLADKEATRQLLSTPQAQQLMKKLFGDKRNG